MTFPGLSLSALPAVTQAAGKALRTSAQAGSQFLSLLASPAQQPSQPDAPSAISDFGQRFTSWLRQHGSLPTNENFSVQLSLDKEDMPHALVNGQPSAAMDQALSDNPTWLEEFRQLAFDRIDDLAGLASASAASMTLTIRGQSDTMMPDVEWKD